MYKILIGYSDSLETKMNEYAKEGYRFLSMALAETYKATVIMVKEESISE